MFTIQKYKLTGERLVVIELPYSKDLIRNYAQLAELPGFVLLESGDQQRGRYDIVSACPYERFFCNDVEKLEAFIDELDSALPVDQSLVDLPFQGGLIGYFSYDFGAHRMGLPVRAQTSLGSSAENLADFGLYDWAIIADHLKKKTILFAANRHKSTPSVIQDVLERWVVPVSDNVTDFSESISLQPLLSHAHYQKRFQAIWDALYQGRCYQVNYTQPFLASFCGEPWDLFQKIRKNNPVPFSAYYVGTAQTLLSFSPERFILQNGDKLLASPIKGTAPRIHDDPIRDRMLSDALIKCEKNRAENTMIVDLWRNDLTQIAEPKTVRVKALCQLESYRSVHHLVSHIEAKRHASINPLGAFLKCFPAGSITGAPKREAMHVIHEQEPYARGAYCGGMAYFSAHGRSDSNIAIRTLIAQNNQLSLSVGGGLVIDSVCADEYHECFHKIQSSQDSLNQRAIT